MKIIALLKFIVKFMLAVVIISVGAVFGLLLMIAHSLVFLVNEGWIKEHNRKSDEALIL